MPYLLCMLYYSIRLVRESRERSKEEKTAVKTLTELKPNRSSADCPRDLEVATKLLAGLARSDAVDRKKLVKAALEVWEQYFPEIATPEEELLRYLLEHAFGSETFDGGKGPEAFPQGEKSMRLHGYGAARGYPALCSRPCCQACGRSTQEVYLDVQRTRLLPGDFQADQVLPASAIRESSCYCFCDMLSERATPHSGTATPDGAMAGLQKTATMVGRVVAAACLLSFHAFAGSSLRLVATTVPAFRAGQKLLGEHVIPGADGGHGVVTACRQFTDSLLTQEGHFLVFYAKDGSDAVSPLDANGDGTPDFVEAIASAFERSYAVEVEELGFVPPPNMAAWSQPYRVYIRDLGTGRGVTVEEGRDPEALVQHRLASHIEVDNDFISPQEHLSPEAAIRATAAHEFFHAIQLGYVSRLITVDGFFAELSAIWMEEQVFPDIEDYRHYLGDFFSAPEIPLNAVSLTVPRIINHMYGASVFAFYLAERFGREVIRQVWEEMVHEPALEAIHRVCAVHGSSFEEEFTRFSIWNYFTGSRSQPGYGYREAATFPEVATAKDTAVGAYAARAGQAYFLTATYLPFRLTQPGTYRLILDGAVLSHWTLAALVEEPPGPRIHQVGPGQTITLDIATAPQAVMVVVCNVDRSVEMRMLYFKEKPEDYLLMLQKLDGRQARDGAPFEVLSAHPNPSSHSVTFTIDRRVMLPMVLDVVDVLGRQVANQAFQTQRSGLFQVTWPGVQALTTCPGVHFFRFSCPSHAQTVKVTFFRP